MVQKLINSYYTFKDDFSLDALQSKSNHSSLFSLHR